MPGFVARSLGRAASHLPEVRRLLIMKLLAAAEVAMRDHITSVIDALRNLPADQASRTWAGTEGAGRAAGARR